MFVWINGLRVFYESSGSGKPVLLLHGWGADSGSLRPIFDALKKSAGIHVYALDFPGFGLSDVPNGGWEVSDFVSVVLDFMNQLQLEKIDIVAHSFGGRVSIKLAVEHPERIERLVLVGSAGIRPRLPVSVRIWAPIARTLGALTRRLPSSLSGTLRERVLLRMGLAEYARTGVRRETYKKVVNEDLRRYLPAVKCPTLLIWGDLDTETPLRDGQMMASLIPHAHLEVLQGTGHWCFLEDFTAFYAALTPFIGGEQKCCL
jgi:pimeloyl-ACP methyl ester carboxylesterase